MNDESLLRVDGVIDVSNIWPDGHIGVSSHLPITEELARCLVIGVLADKQLPYRVTKSKEIERGG